MRLQNIALHIVEEFVEDIRRLSIKRPRRLRRKNRLTKGRKVNQFFLCKERMHLLMNAGPDA